MKQKLLWLLFTGNSKYGAIRHLSSASQIHSEYMPPSIDANEKAMNPKWLNFIKLFALIFIIQHALLLISPISGNGAYAQSISKFVTPSFISGCNNDTIKIELTNTYGAKGIVYTGPVKYSVTVPAAGTIKYIAGTVSSVPAGATSSSPTGNTVDIDVPLPALGQKTIIKFVVNADCNVLNLNPLPQFTATATYPSPYPITSEIFNSAALSVGNAQLNVGPYPQAGYNNTNQPFGANFRRIVRIRNGGYGSIDNVKITVTTPSVFIPTSDDGIFGNDAGVYPITAISTTIVGTNTVKVYELTGKYLGADGLLTPGDFARLDVYAITPAACGIYDSEFKVEYTCAGGAIVCDKPQFLKDRTTVAAGTPNLAGALVSVEYPDGCPKKKIVYTVTNIAGGDGNPTGNAYDVKLNINLGTGKAVISDVKMNTLAVTTNGGLNNQVIDATQFTTDPDGAGGLEDLDGDGKFDDMKVGATTSIEFLYSIPCTIACGEDLNYNFSSNNTFTDYCRTLVGATNTGLATFGFAQVPPLTQTKVDYGIVPENESVTRRPVYTFQYKQTNLNLSAAVATLCINYSKSMEINPNTVKLNGVVITGTIQGADTQSSTTTTDAGQTATSNDSVWVHVLTAAEVAALFDATPDSLGYDQTYYGCTDRQTTKSSNNWQLKLILNPTCTDGSTPCVFDLVCKKPFVYGSGTTCPPPKPCYVTDLNFYRDQPVGYTDVTKATLINPIDSTRAYARDTVALDNQYLCQWRLGR